MLEAQWPLLSSLVWLPILGGIIILAFSTNEKNTPATRWIALAFSAVTFLISIKGYHYFDVQNAAMQLKEHYLWIPTFNIYYSLGIDGISLLLILLTTLMTFLVVLAGWQVIQNKVAQYMAAFLIMEGLMNGVFAALDSVLFYVFWEAMLIPMLLIIGIWGGPNRVYATIKFFLYTFLGSVFMLVALIFLYIKADSFMIVDLYRVPLDMTTQVLIFFAFLIAFAVKIPMWPVHTWLPDAHVEAPTGGSVILAAIMLKMGAYGFIRFSLPIVPDASQLLSGLMIALSLIAIVYIGFVAIVQKDMKKLIAYSSIAHMGFVTLGFFVIFAIVANTEQTQAAIMGIEGGIIQMISHGFIAGAMFLCVGVVYDRMHTRNIADYGGVANTMPIYATLFMIFALANAGLPGTSGFVGEFYVILSAFQAKPWIAIIAGLALVLGPAYTLWMYKRVLFGAVANEKVAALQDVNGREFLILGLLVVLVFLFGVWPSPMIDVMHVSVETLLPSMLQTKL